jgi:hypothetical protein
MSQSWLGCHLRAEPHDHDCGELHLRGPERYGTPL